ncbi:hypothetical protein S83_061919 [Arachis hypogaea]
MASADREPRPIESHSRLIALFEKEAVSDHGRVIRLRRRGAEILNKGLVTSWGNAFIRIGSGLEPALSRLRIRISNLSIVLVRFRWGATIPLVVQDQVLAHCDGIAGMEGPPTPPGIEPKHLLKRPNPPQRRPYLNRLFYYPGIRTSPNLGRISNRYSLLPLRAPESWGG